MRLMELKLTMTCIPTEKEDNTVHCDIIGGCGDCLKKIFMIVEKSSEDIQNFKIEQCDITRIIDFKKRRWNEIGKRTGS